MSWLHQITDHREWLGSGSAALIGLLTRRKWWPRFWAVSETIFRPYVTIGRQLLVIHDLRLAKDRETRRADAAEANTVAAQTAFENLMTASRALMQGAEEVQRERAAGRLVTVPDSSNGSTNSPPSSSSSPPRREGPLGIP